MTFLNRDSGYLVLLLLLQSATGPDQLEATLKYDYAAQIGSVSRTHVRMMVEDAERLGLLRVLESGGRRIHLTPTLWQLADRWFLDCFSSFDENNTPNLRHVHLNSSIGLVGS